LSNAYTKVTGSDKTSLCSEHMLKQNVSHLCRIRY